MKRWLILALCLAAPSARADEIKCRAADPTMNVQVIFTTDPTVRNVVLWLMGSSCKSVIMDAGIPEMTVKISSGALRSSQVEARAIAAFEAAGLVVTKRPDTLIITRSGKRPCPDPAGGGTGPVTSIPVTPVTADTTEPDAPTEGDILAGIKQVSPTAIEVKESTLEKLLANPMAAMKGARVVPAMKNGKTIGIKLYAIRPGSFYAKLGFANGDTVMSINGMTLESADKGLEIYTKLREQKRFDVVIERAGKPVTIVVRIVK